MRRLRRLAAIVVLGIAIDAICLVKGPFAPSGVLKPGEAEAAAAARAAAGYVWIEGEGAEKTNVAPSNLWLKGDTLTLLSRGDALTEEASVLLQSRAQPGVA